MRTISIDDEPWMLRHFEEECKVIPNIQLIGSYRNPLLALDFAANNSIDLAFIDIEMPLLNGPETARRLKALQPNIQIIFISAYEPSVISSMPDMESFGYLRKPYNRSDLLSVLDKTLNR